jgi:anti-sigma B factor antagonist
MRECKIMREEREGLDIVKLDGALDAYSFPRLETMLNELRDTQRHRVILDGSGLDYISSASLGALIGFARRAREQGGDMKLANLSPKIVNIIELLGFHKILELYDDVEQAAAKF